MRIIPAGAKYESKVYVIDEDKLIYKLYCSCPNFSGMKIAGGKFMGSKRIKKTGEYADIKYYSEPCKHLKPAVERLIKMGYILKKPKEMTGDDTLKPKLKAQLMERALGCCEGKKLNEEGVYGKCCGMDRLNAHRKVREGAGGKYNMENCVILCWGCHRGPQGVHSNEFRGCQGK